MGEVFFSGLGVVPVTRFHYARRSWCVDSLGVELVYVGYGDC